MNRNQIKLAMMLLMVLDHIHPFVSLETAALFHIVSRGVSVFFAYMCVEELFHTNNQEKYLARLWLAGIGMQIGNVLLNHFVFAEMYRVHNNIFLTLAIGTTILYFIQYLKETIAWKSKLLYQTAIFFLAGIALLTEEGTLIIPFMFIYYLETENIHRRNRYLFLFSLFLFLVHVEDSSKMTDSLAIFAHSSDFLFISVLPVLAVYHGNKGYCRSAMNDFFYFFYPAHLYLIAFVATWLAD